MYIFKRAPDETECSFKFILTQHMLIFVSYFLKLC